MARGAQQFATVADDDIAIGSLADRFLLSGDSVEKVLFG